MNKQISPIIKSSFSRLIDSPLQSFVDEFFNDALPITLLNRSTDYPKYNIVKLKKEDGEQENAGDFCIEMSVAGFCKEAIDIYTKDNTLFVDTTKVAGEAEKEYYYKGISTRPFKWSLKLPQRAEISDVKLTNGILYINVRINIPEEEKYKRYCIE